MSVRACRGVISSRSTQPESACTARIASDAATAGAENRVRRSILMRCRSVTHASTSCWNPSRPEPGDAVLGRRLRALDLRIRPALIGTASPLPDALRRAGGCTRLACSSGMGVHDQGERTATHREILADDQKGGAMRPSRIDRDSKPYAAAGVRAPRGCLMHSRRKYSHEARMRSDAMHKGVRQPLRLARAPRR